jgi:hypothetical protein
MRTTYTSLRMRRTERPRLILPMLTPRQVVTAATVAPRTAPTAPATAR